MTSKSADIRQTLLVDRLADLGPGTPNPAVKMLLAGLTPEEVEPHPQGEEPGGAGAASGRVEPESLLVNLGKAYVASLLSG